MAFAQLAYRESLRDIETCLRALQPKLYQAGIRSKIARSTLGEANENRDWPIYADFAQVLIGWARKLYAEDHFGMTLEQTAYAFDSTTIDLCLSLFPWAQFRKRKGANQNPYAEGLAGQHTLFYPHYRRENPRCIKHFCRTNSMRGKKHIETALLVTEPLTDQWLPPMPFTRNNDMQP